MTSLLSIIYILVYIATIVPNLQFCKFKFLNLPNILFSEYYIEEYVAF
ncbi:protein of unknown function [Clostridium beijerinckii]|nr:protein of unknown function [Clostridium beijerinckii]